MEAGHFEIKSQQTSFPPGGEAKAISEGSSLDWVEKTLSEKSSLSVSPKSDPGRREC